MKLMSFNLFQGCKEEKRLSKIVNFTKKINPDILGLLELDGWDKDNFAKLEKLKKDTGFPYSIFCASESGHHIALLSKNKPNSEATVSKGFRIGMIKAVFNNFTVILTHLDSRNEDFRTKELDILKNYFDNKTVLMGDLNSLSPLDDYNERNLIKNMQKLGTEKFGTNELRKDVIKCIMSLGFVDAVKQNPKFEYSVPTNYKSDAMHFAKLRLDYIFTAKDLAKKVKKSMILRSKETENLSDHFPVLIEF